MAFPLRSTPYKLIPMVLVMGMIFFLSHQSGERLYSPPLMHSDKLAHMAVYGLLAASVLFGFSPAKEKASPLTLPLFALVVSTLYGITDEFHQTFIPLRDASFLDLVADFSGALLVCILWLWRQNKKTS